MSDLFELSRFDEYKEDNRREVKKAHGGLPASLWETYSAFANCYGGVIILGVKEESDGTWKTTGLKDEAKLLKDFWNTINNRQKVNINLLNEKDINSFTIGEQKDVIIVIYVPMAKREEKPVYINDNMFNGTYRRNYEGDYRCTRLQVKAMLRDQTETTMDMNVLDEISMDELNYETIHGYRNRHRTLKPGHPFEKLDDHGYLRSIGAAAISSADKELHPTAAGMLMFGDEYNIVRHFPEYFLDYREILDPTIRWTDRLQSSSGEWSGNLCDFYFRVYNKLVKDIKIPFKTVGGNRIDDTPMHEAIREALANCLVNADYQGTSGIVIKKEIDKIIIENPGYIRLGKTQMRLGGVSDPRNKTLMKMFNLINIGERAGSGVPKIFNIWADEGLQQPEIIEGFDPDRTVLVLPLEKEKYSNSNFLNKTLQQLKNDSIIKLMEYLDENEEITTAKGVEITGKSAAQVRRYLKVLCELGILKSTKATKGNIFIKQKNT